VTVLIGIVSLVVGKAEAVATVSDERHNLRDLEVCV
jgi:hypothetical protein